MMSGPPKMIEQEYASMSQAANRILRSVRQARAYARGETTEGFAVHIPETVDVKATPSPRTTPPQAPG